jgi:hypothetical protein
MRIEVSTRPRGRRTSGPRPWILVDQRINVCSEPRTIDRRRPSEGAKESCRRNEHAASHRQEFPYWYAVTSDDVGLAAIEATHDLATVVPQCPLRDHLRHSVIVAPVLQVGPTEVPLSPTCVQESGIPSRRLPIFRTLVSLNYESECRILHSPFVV